MVFPSVLWRKNTSKLRAVWGKIHQVETSLKTMSPAHHHSIILTCHGVSVPLLQSLQSATNTKDTIDSDASREASTNKPKHSASGKNPTRPVEVVERCGVFNQTNVPSCLVIKFKGCIYRVEIFDAVGVWSHLMFSWHWACCQQKNAPHPKKTTDPTKHLHFGTFFFFSQAWLARINGNCWLSLALMSLRWHPKLQSQANQGCNPKVGALWQPRCQNSWSSAPFQHQI